MAVSKWEVGTQNRKYIEYFQNLVTLNKLKPSCLNFLVKTKLIKVVNKYLNTFQAKKPIQNNKQTQGLVCF